MQVKRPERNSWQCVLHGCFFRLAQSDDAVSWMRRCECAANVYFLSCLLFSWGVRLSLWRLDLVYLVLFCADHHLIPESPWPLRVENKFQTNTFSFSENCWAKEMMSSVSCLVLFHWFQVVLRKVSSPHPLFCSENSTSKTWWMNWWWSKSRVIAPQQTHLKYLNAVEHEWLRLRISKARTVNGCRGWDCSDADAQLVLTELILSNAHR